MLKEYYITTTTTAIIQFNCISARALHNNCTSLDNISQVYGMNTRMLQKILQHYLHKKIWEEAGV